MTSITEIRTAGTDLILIPRPIYEPLAAPEPLANKLHRFGEHYDLSTNSNLFKFLLGLCGETGAGQIKKAMLYPRLQQVLGSTYFQDLDRLYGNPLALPRLSEEIYDVDPRNEALTQEEWAEVRIKDAQYRSRCLTWMRAVIEGPTPEGMRLACEAATGYDAIIKEQYEFIENSSSDSPLSLQNYGRTNSRNEFVIIVLNPALTQEEQRRIAHLVDRLRPTNTIPTVYTSASNRAQRFARVADSSSSTFNVRRLVTGRGDISWPDVDPSKGLWIEAGVEKEAPTFAFMDRQEAITFLSVTSVTASSSHTGPFSKDQRDLFSHLREDFESLHEFSPEQSYSNSLVPIQLSIPWVSGG